MSTPQANTSGVNVSPSYFEFTDFQIVMNLNAEQIMSGLLIMIVILKRVHLLNFYESKGGQEWKYDN